MFDAEAPWQGVDSAIKYQYRHPALTLCASRHAVTWAFTPDILCTASHVQNAAHDLNSLYGEELIVLVSICNIYLCRYIFKANPEYMHSNDVQ